ncbi:hypothetical protein WAK64_00140 [Bacillus spongiae]|uniref:Uncharacterized protein n=2 Tax=Bacillus spongiae TaxID=2683610 RepID=A0ABU8H8E1_9BACI
MKQRYLLCFLLAGAMLYYAAPRLTLSISGIEGYFSIAWLAFAFIVLAGNLTAMLFTKPVKTKSSKKRAKTLQRNKMKSLGM